MKKKLMEKRADLLTKLEALNGKENFSAEDQTQFDNLTNEMKDIDKQLDNIQVVEEARKGHASATVSDSESKEVAKNYNFLQAMNMAKNGKLDGFVAEMHQEAEREAARSGITLSGSQSLLIPTVVQTAKIFSNTAVIATEPAQGGRAVATELKSFVEYLHERLVLAQLGADFVPGLIGNIAFPKENAVAEMTWGGEIDDADESSPSFLLNEMKPKRGSTFVDVSNQVLLQTSGAMGGRIANQLISAVARGIEKAAIYGTGADDQPRGILATSGIGDVAGGTNGLAPTWAHIVDLESKVAIENADLGSLGYLTNSKVRGKLKTTSKVSGQNGFIWEGDGTVNGYRTGVTNLVPSNLVKGDSGAICSAIVFGNFNDLLIGQWGPIELFPNPYTKAKKGITEMIINIYVDVLVQRAQSFAAMKDALTT